MTKTFVVLAGIFILVGGSIGGAFVGGMIIGENRAESEAPATAQLPLPGGQAGQAAALGQFAEQIPLDDEGNPDFAALRQMAQAQGRGLPTPPGRTPTASADTDMEETVSITNTEEADDDGGDDSSLPPFGRGLGLLGGGATFGTIESINRWHRNHQHPPGNSGSRHRLGNRHSGLRGGRTGRLAGGHVCNRDGRIRHRIRQAGRRHRNRRARRRRSVPRPRRRVPNTP